MKFSRDDKAAEAAEEIMLKLKASDALKSDEPNHAFHYNRAFSAVYEVMQLYFPPTQKLDSGTHTIPFEAVKFPEWWKKP